jgi:hypothetical protein
MARFFQPSGTYRKRRNRFPLPLTSGIVSAVGTASGTGTATGSGDSTRVIQHRQFTVGALPFPFMVQETANGREVVYGSAAFTELITIESVSERQYMLGGLPFPVQIEDRSTLDAVHFTTMAVQTSVAAASYASGVGSASGTGTASAVGRSTAASAASAAGTGAANGVG